MIRIQMSKLIKMPLMIQYLEAGILKIKANKLKEVVLRKINPFKFKTILLNNLK